MKKGKNKLLKASLAVVALTFGVGYISTYPIISPTYAQTIEDNHLQELISLNTKWSYLDNNVDPGTSTDRYAWTKAGYDVSSWKVAAGKFGAKRVLLQI